MLSPVAVEGLGRGHCRWRYLGPLSEKIGRMNQ